MRPILVIVLILLATQLEGQKMHLRQINTEGEIPAHEIYNVFQDSKNYIWFASDAGVWRFDGKSYKGYTSANGLPDNVVFGFFEDNKKRLWLKMYSNKIAYIKNNKVTVLPCNDKLAQLKKNEIISSIFVDNNDAVYISHMRSNDIIRITPPYKEKDIRLIRINTKCGNYIYETPTGGILVGSTTYSKPEKIRFDSVAIINANKYTYFKCKNACIDHPRTMLSKQADGSYLIGLSNTLFQYKNKKLTELISFPNSILSSIIDRDQNLWVATDVGLFQFDETDKEYANPAKYFLGDFANCILQDKEKSFWIVTLKSGLYYAPFKDVSLTNFENKFSQNLTCSFYDTSQHLSYVFCYSKLLKLQKNKMVGSVDFNFNEREINYVSQVIPLDGFKLLCLGRQTFILDRKTNEITRICLLKNTQFFPRTVTGIYFNDSVFCSGQSSLYTFSEKTKTLNPYDVFEEKINTLCKFNKNVMLIGTERGLIQYNVFKKEKKHIALNKNNSSIISIQYLQQLDAYFIVLKSGLIYLIDKNYTILKTSPIINGLTVRKAVVDANNLLWLSTNKGIYTLDTNLHFTCIDKIHGLPENLINSIEIADNTVFACSENGLITFPHNKSFTNNNPPDLYYTGIKVNGKYRNIDTTYQLKYNENFIKVFYQALNYRTNGKVTCKYILHGIDKHWNTTTHSVVEYTTLPYGNYHFELYVLNNDNVRSKQSIKIHFIIHPPYWLTWWFLLLVLASIIALLVLIFMLRINQIKKREKEKNEIARKMGEVKLLALSSQMHPHFVFNSINSIQHYILANEPLNANKYLTKFSKLMRNILEQSRQEKITLKEELDTVLLYLEMESLRFEDSFDYKIQSNTNQPTNRILVPPLIIQPLVENAIWHGLLLKKDEKKLTITVYSDNNYLFIEVDDNGIGREQAQRFKSEKVKKESLGLKIIQERLKLLQNISNLNTDIIVLDKQHNRQTTGTKITLKIPLILYTP